MDCAAPRLSTAFRPWLERRRPPGRNRQPLTENRRISNEECRISNGPASALVSLRHSEFLVRYSAVRCAPRAAEPAGCASRSWQVSTFVGATPCGRPAFDVSVDPYAAARAENNGRAATWGRPYGAEQQLPKNPGAPGRPLTWPGRTARTQRPAPTYCGPATAQLHQRVRPPLARTQPMVVCCRWGHVWCKPRAKNRLDIIVYILENKNAKSGGEK